MYSNLIAAMTFGRLALKDALFHRSHVWEPAAHLQAALDWLTRAQDLSSDDGVSYGYSLRGAWRPSYIETTGYIAVTFFKVAKVLNAPEFHARAVQMVDWLRSVQGMDGSFANPRYGDRGIVFDTGQDLFGLVWAYKETGERRFLEAAERAGDWLVQVADADGCWTRNEHLGVRHVYNTRSAWALLQLQAVAPSAERGRIARANLDWGVSQQLGSGLFDNCSFRPGVPPFTHTIAYAVEGFWESGLLLREDRYCDAALRAADAVSRHIREDGFISGQISIDNTPHGRYCCLTGNCQLAVVWAKLYRRSGDLQHRNAAVSSLRYVMSLQDITTRNADVRGGIKGSHPIWGRYSPFTYPNWATKFFVDALLECGEWL